MLRSSIVFRSAITVGFSAMALTGCGQVAEEAPTQPLQEEPAAARTTTSAVFIAKRDGSSIVVRVDANDKTVRALTPPLPAAFIPSSFVLATVGEEERFLVVGKESGAGVAYRGTAQGWTAVEKRKGGWFMVPDASADLALFVLSSATEGGSPLETTMYRWDGTLVRTTGLSTNVKALGTNLAVFEETSTDATGARSKRLEVVDAQGAPIMTLPPLGRDSEIVARPSDLVLRDGPTCRTIAFNPTSETSFPCESLLDPFVSSNGSILRLDGDDLTPVAAIPLASPGELLHFQDGMAAFVAKRDGDGVQSFTFVNGQTSTTYDPGPADGRQWTGLWTRSAGDATRACVVFDIENCPAGDVACGVDFVEVACSDGKDLRSRRFERTRDAGPRDFAFATDARFFYFREGARLHAVDSTTFEEVAFDAPYEFQLRDGEPPSPNGRPW